MKIKSKKLLSLILALSFGLSLVGCGSSSSSQHASPEYAKSEEGMDYAEPNGSRMDGLPLPELEGALPDGKERKLTYSSSVSISTLDFEKSMEELDKIIKENDLIVQQRSSYSNDSFYRGYESRNNRRVSIYLRVPMNKYQETMSSLQNIGHITDKNERLDDITKSYYDSKARLEVLETEKERLMTWLSNAQTTEDMLNIEERLSGVQANIESIKNSLEVMDFDVSYSKLDIDISEVYRYDAPREVKIPYLTELKDTFVSSIKGFVSFLRGLSLAFIEYLPYILLIALIIYVVRKIRIKRGFDPKKAKEEKALKKQAKKQLREEKQKLQREKDEKFKAERQNKDNPKSPTDQK